MNRSGGDSVGLRSADLGVSCACCNGCAPPKGSNGEQGPDGNERPAQPSPFGLRRVSAALRQAGRRTRQRSPSPYPLPRHGRASIKGEGGSPSPLPSPPPRAGKHRGRGGYETASKPYGAEGRIADEYGVCQYILTRPSPQRRGERRGRMGEPSYALRATAGRRRTTNGFEARSPPRAGKPPLAAFGRDDTP